MTPHEVGVSGMYLTIGLLVGTFILDAVVLRRAPDAARLEWTRAPQYLRSLVPNAAKYAPKYFASWVAIDMVVRLVGDNSRTLLHSVQQGALAAVFIFLMGTLWPVLAACIAHSVYSPPSISSCPGWRLHRCARWIFSQRTFVEVLEPVLSDMQVEYFVALDENRPRKAQWVRLRGYLCFWSHVALQIPVDIGRIIVVLWRLGH